ncbi:hypothetical protein [Plantactinospora sonchi]|uniref:Mce-associated membrane protein n=1 Tax=Plantactinospora sonchi TaxID=1544735 RepID=A0ABU7S0Y5_9ACTN
MSNGEERRLKLVKAAPPSEPDDTARQPVRRRKPAARRTVTRRMPGRDPVSAVLERLDEEPVDLVDRSRRDQEPADAADRAGTVEPPADAARPDKVADAVRADGPGDAARPGEVADDRQPDEVTGEPRSERAAERRPARNRRQGVGPGAPRRRGLTAGLIVLLCAALALAGFFGNRWYQDRALVEAHGQAVAAARQTTVNFVSVSASRVDGDLQRIVAGATGEFKEEFLRGQAQVRAAVIENRVESTGTVLRAGLVSGDRRTAVVLVAVDATVRNTHAPDGRVAHYRIQVELTRDRDSDTWLVSRLQFVG